MTTMKLISEDHIAKLEKLEHEKLHNMLDQHIVARGESWKRKEQWLAVFSKSLSPSVSCKQSDVSRDCYRRWRNTDPRFCRALNTIIEEAHDEMVGTAYARATGYLQHDVDSDTGFQEDATGRPIRHGVSDRLAIALIGAERKDRELNSPVNITISLGALGVTSTPPELEHLPSNVIEAEFPVGRTEDEPDE
jgi:hypothetical protein